MWSKKITAFLKKLGFEPTFSDPSLFVALTRYTVIVYLLLYVDDGLVFCKDKAIAAYVIKMIKQEFEITQTNLTQFLGMGVIYDQPQRTLFLSQEKSIKELLQKFNLSDCKATEVPMQPNLELTPATEPDLKYPYRELIGSLLFIARTTRPDIAYAVAKMAQFSNSFDETHWKVAKGILRYLKGTMNMGIFYGQDNGTIVEGYTDSDYAGDKIDRKSTSGFIFMMGNSPISWSSNKQPIVALLSTEAEYIALASGAKEACWFRSILQEIGRVRVPIALNVDNTSAIRLAENAVFHQRSKHLDIKYHFIRDLIQKGHVAVDYIPTEEQRADILTKPLLKTKFQEMRQLAGIGSNLAVDGPEEKGKGRKQTQTNAKMNGATVLWTLALFGCCFFAPSTATTLQNSQPVLWRPSNTPVMAGYEKVYIRIKMMNPCDLFTKEILHVDIAEEARKQCEVLYEEYILNELTEMCPRDDVLYQPRRAKRELILLTCLIISGIVLWAGMGTAVGLSISNKVTTSSLAEIQQQQADQLDAIESRLNLTEIAITSLQVKHNKLTDKVEFIGNDVSELKTKLVSTTFLLCIFPILAWKTSY